jgi:hypothetical protein
MAKVIHVMPLLKNMINSGDPLYKWKQDEAMNLLVRYLAVSWVSRIPLLVVHTLLFPVTFKHAL